jgi:hypothetical protein
MKYYSIPGGFGSRRQLLEAPVSQTFGAGDIEVDAAIILDRPSLFVDTRTDFLIEWQINRTG